MGIPVPEKTAILLNQGPGLNGEWRYMRSNIIRDCSFMPDAIKCIVL